MNSYKYKQKSEKETGQKRNWHDGKYFIPWILAYSSLEMFSSLSIHGCNGIKTRDKMDLCFHKTTHLLLHDGKCFPGSKGITAATWIKRLRFSSPSFSIVERDFLIWCVEKNKAANLNKISWGIHPICWSFWETTTASARPFLLRGRSWSEGVLGFAKLWHSPSPKIKICN